MADSNDGKVFYMWPTTDGKGWVVATEFEGHDVDTVLRKIKEAGLPQPISWGGPPPRFLGV